MKLEQSQILNKNKKMFGKSSEQVDSNQMSLFDEAEKNSDNKIAEPTVLEVTYTRKQHRTYLISFMVIYIPLS